MRTMPSFMEELGVECVTPPDHYVELGLIGNGAYGTVYKGRSREDGSIVALKKIRVQLTDEGLPMSTLREIATLKQIDRYEHPNVIRLLDICHGKGLDRHLMLYLVFEHMDQDLATFMARCPPPGIPTETIKNYTHQILCGIDFLHSHRILHRDLKPQNLLITNSGAVKIADFGLAKIFAFDMRLTSVVVTLWYRSPEVLLGCPYATAVDMWSVGCIMAEMYKKSPMFSGTSEGDQLDKIFRVIGTPSVDEWPEDVSVPLRSFQPRSPVDLASIIPSACELAMDLLQKIFKFNPEVRITATDALDHEYFKGSDYNLPDTPDPSSSSDSSQADL